MALIRLGSTRIRTGASRVMQRAPSQPATRPSRRAAPKKEIAFIAEAKKLEEAKKGKKEVEPKGVVARTDINTIVQTIKDTGLSGAEAGYAIDKAFFAVYGKERDQVRKGASKIPTFIHGPKAEERREEEQEAIQDWRKGIFSGLKPELKTWADNNLTEYYDVMKAAKAEYKSELEEIKDKYGDDPRKYTNERLKMMARVYPSWSKDAQSAVEKFKERQGKLADAISAAKKAGVKGLTTDEIYSLATTTPKTAREWGAELGLSKKQIATIRDVGLEELYKPEEIAGTRITLTDKDIPREMRNASAEEQEKLGIKKVDGKWQQNVVTTATGQYIPATLFDALAAKQKAEVIAAPVGTMIGAGAGAIIMPEVEEEPVLTIEATAEEKKKAKEAKAEAEARGWSCYTQIYTYKVKMKDGTTILVEAFSESSAEQKAKDAGYKPAWVTKKMRWETIEPAKTPTGAFNVTGEDGETVTMVPFEHKETGETLLIPKDAAEELKDTEAYKDAKGTDEQKLGIALSITQSEFNNWLKDLEKEHPDLYKVYEEKGYDALKDTIQQQATRQRDVMSTLDKSYKLDKGYDITAALINKDVTADELKLAGFKGSEITKANKAAQEVLDLEKEFLARSKESRELITRMALTPEPQRSAVLKEAGKGNEASWIVDKKYDELTADEKLKVLERYESQVKPGALAVTKKYLRTVAEPIIMFTPVVGTIAYWNKMAPWERALSIAGDIACVTFVVQAGAAAARATKGYTAGSRIKAAAKGAGQAVLAEATAPIEMVAHPIQTTKGIGRQIQSAIETLAHPKKLPLGATELSYTTTRLPVDDVGGAKKAMELRDAAVAAAIRGKPGKATVGKVTLELKPTELQKVGGAIALHQTPDVRPFLNGAVVKGGTEGSGLFISPNFHSRFAHATAFGDIPEGGIKGGLIIRDEKVLKTLVPSGKIYRSAAEIEAVLKPGTKLPAPSQVLFTRDIAGNKLTFLVIGKPYTQAQIAKLKLLGSLDTMAQVFKPTMKLTGPERKAITAMDDIIELAEERAKLARQLEAARTAGKAEVVRTLNQRIDKLDNKIDTLVKRVNTPRESIRPDNLAWAQYADKGILERYQELSPKRARATDRGTRLPAIRPALAMRAAAARASRKVTGKEPYVLVKYERGKAPGYAPCYVPAKAPPYAPVKIPPAAPMPTPPYTISRVAPARPPRIAVTKEPPKQPTRKSVTPIKLGRERIPRQPDSLVSWRQGRYFITIVDPYRTTGTKPDVIFSRGKPPGAKVATGRRSPQKTLLSKGKVPKLITLPMGATTARVKHGRVLGFTRSSTVRRGRRRR